MKREKFDPTRPDAQAMRDRICHGAFMTEGTMVAFPTCFPGMSQPLPGDESRITALDVAANGIVYAGAGGHACHLLVGMFHGVTGLVFDMGTVSGADRVAGICCGLRNFVAAVDGPRGGTLVSRRLEPLPFDLIQEWHIGRSPLTTLKNPAGREHFLHAVAEAGRQSALVLTPKHLLRVVFETGKVNAVAVLPGQGRLARGADGAVYGLDGKGDLWRCRPDRGVERHAVKLPDGAWGPRTAWAADPAGKLTYAVDEQGQLFAMGHTGKFGKALARLPLAPVTAMAATFDGRLFGTAGEGMSRFFRFDPRDGAVADLGVAVSVFERRRYGYSFADAVVGRDGEIIFAENEDLGHLWLYFPKIQATPGK